MRVTTDQGDWSTLTRRHQLALVCIALTGLAAGIAASVNAVSIVGAIVLAMNVGIAFQWVFTRRRPWWRSEPTTEPDRLEM